MQPLWRPDDCLYFFQKAVLLCICPQNGFFYLTHFAKIMAFVAQKGKSVGLSMKQTNKELMLVADEVKGIKGVKRVLEAVEMG